MSTTDDRPYAGAFREWWLRRSFYAKNFLILDAIALFVLLIALVAGGSYSETETRYLNTVHNNPALSSFSDDQALELGYTEVCAASDNGVSGYKIWINLVDLTGSGSGATTIYASAASSLCTEHYDDMKWFFGI